MIFGRVLFWTVALTLSILVSGVQAEEIPSLPLTIDQAIEYALLHHPAIREAGALEESAAAQTELARSGLLPGLFLSAQENRATGNVVTGSLFAMPNIPVVSGPPTGRELNSGVFGRAISLSVSWDIVGLVRRMAVVDAALAEREHAHAGADAQRLDAAFTAANAFLGAVAAGETMKAAQAGAERARIFAARVKTLVEQELRPGADASRAEAEMAIASTELIRTKEAEAIRKVELARALGIAGTQVETLPGKLLGIPFKQSEGGLTAPKHPLLVEAEAAVAAERARKHAIELEYLPRVEVVSALWSRGSGSGNSSEAQGLLPNTPNWAAGIVATWPILDIFSIRARAHQESAGVELSISRHDDIAQGIESQIAAARATLEGARQVAQNTPVELEAARAAERQANARYDAGLTSVVEVAESQRLLAKAEADDALARLGIWQGMLLLARATGDLTPFLAEVHSVSEGER